MVILNPVLIHEDLDPPKVFTTCTLITYPRENQEGPVFLQNHSNLVVFRNIWIPPGQGTR